MAEFKIGRLRFTWKGQWSTATFYNRDAVVEYNGKTYICLVPHTSTDFYSGLYFIDQGGASTPYWTIMLEGKTWKGPWMPSTLYSLGNLVAFGGTVYVCTIAHTSDTVALNPANFAIYVQASAFNGPWSTNTAYGLGDQVQYGGIVYGCITNHVSASTITLGLEANQADWEIVFSGIDYKTAWAPSTRYKLNDVVKRGAGLWIANIGHTSSTSFDAANWNVWLPGEEYANLWLDTTVYQVGDAVKYGGYSYISNTANNTANIPSMDSTDWTLESIGYNLRGDWDSATQYRVGDVVRNGGRVYSAIADNSGHDPSGTVVRTNYTASGSSGTTVVVVSTFGIVPGMLLLGNGFSQRQAVVSVTNSTTLKVSSAPDGIPTDGIEIKFTGVDPNHWAIVTPGINWMNRWVNSTIYTVGDLAVWQNATYFCVGNHTASNLLRPDLDTTGEYWQVYLYHARKNALNTYGDLETFANGVYTTVPMPLLADQADQLLRSTNGIPVWQKINTVPNVFYVTTTGLDLPSYGTTWDRPWHTIKYACETIGTGLAFVNTAGLILANRDFLTAEVYQWMLYQVANNIAPFTTASVFDQTKTIRDAGLIIDAIAYDIARGGNSQTVAATTAYFVTEFQNTFVTPGVAAEMPYIIAALARLDVLIAQVIVNTPITNSYQAANGVAIPVLQVYDSQYVSEPDAATEIASLYTIVNTALSAQDKSLIPLANQGLTATVMIKTGTYPEMLPISVPENVALVGDELRGVVVQPARVVDTIAFATSSTTNRIQLDAYDNIDVGTALQFIGTTLTMIGGLTSGQTYYAIDIDTDLGIILSTTATGAAINLTDSRGSVLVYGGDAISDMFYMRNASGIRNMTLTGLLGTLGAPNSFTTQRPTGGSFVSLDPGTGPNDSSAWIIRRSPYIQNVTNFGIGCVGAKIDGTLHNGGLKSIVANDFTQILSDGIGVWCTGPGSLTELVSVFAYYGYAGYMAEDGGRIRATNGNTSYGTYGVIAEGFDATESPVTGNVYNRSTQVQASVQSSFGSNAQLLALQFANSGSAYNQTTTNMLKDSNNFISTWSTDGNLVLQKNLVAPNGIAEAWTLTSQSVAAGSSYLYQNMTVQPNGATYTALGASNVTGSGTSATFNVTVTSTSYVVTVNSGGSGYVTGNQLVIPGSLLGGLNNTNDCIITVASLAGSSILTVTNTGTVPAGSAFAYTFSLYTKKGTASNIDIQGIFSGGVTNSVSGVTFNYDTGTFTGTNTLPGTAPVRYGKLTLPNGWFRIWVSVNDATGLNNALQYRIFPTGAAGGATGYSYIYGAQTEISGTTYSPSFYLQTTSDMFTSYANFNIVGAGTGAVLIGEEIRSKAVFQTRVVDDGNGEGGSGYLTASNAAQGGTSARIVISGSDINAASNYIGMRVFINSGTGAGQYAYISAYDSTLKIVQVLKESFSVIDITSIDSSSNLLLGTSSTTESLYLNQPVQFIPTAYTTNISSIAIDKLSVTGILGGVINTLTVSSTARLRVNQPITFSGGVVGGVVEGYTYFIAHILSDTTLQVATQPGGAVWPLNTATPSVIMYLSFPTNDSYINGDTTNMLVNMPIQFTGTSIGGISVGVTYYISDVIDSSTFSIATSLLTQTVTATSASTNAFTVTDTTGLAVFNPVLFAGTVFGNVVEGTKYYISKVINGTTFSVVNSLVSTTARASAVTSNLITVDSTTGFIPGNPIEFIGTTFGDIVTERVYYILAVNDATTFTISATVGGSAVNLSTATGEMIVQTTPAVFTLSTATGTMTATSTPTKMALSAGYGTVIGTFKTALFGGVAGGTTYYIVNIDPSGSIKLASTPSGTALTFTAKSGSMKMGEVGWDHINPGTPIAVTLDSSSVYYIEPRTTFTAPNFTQSSTTPIVLAPGISWNAIAYGNNMWMALPTSGTIAAISTDGATWTNITLPSDQTWTSIAYGNGYWVAVAAASNVAIYSNSNGRGWRTSALPATTTWQSVVYGNGRFIATSGSSTDVAYSTNSGKTWTASGAGVPMLHTSAIAYGNKKFVAIMAGVTGAAFSTDGNTWTSTTLPAGSNWASIVYGNGRFVAVSSTSASPIYSFDGITWITSPMSIAANLMAYGQGVFVALSTSGAAYISESGDRWKSQSVTSTTYGAITFGYTASTFVGEFVTLAGTNTGSIIAAGTRAKGRAVITSGVITSISQWEPGSNYTSNPTVTFTDPNVTTLATVSTRLGSGTLANPTFNNRGTGYSTTSTAITITGSGYADAYQTGLTIICKNLTKLPQPGDNLVINGVSQIYKITSATAAFGTTAPSIEANIQVAPEIKVIDSPDEGTTVTIRQKYSQVRLTGHDFLNVGFGNQTQSNFPSLPSDTILSPEDQAVEVNFGRVFYTSTDQDGNFKVGGLFAVEQATGIVTLSASQFGLSGLETISLGGIAVGGSSVVIRQFSTDSTFVANSNEIIPTQKAIKSYLTGRLSQGGSNTFTGQLIAGTVLVGGPDKIASTIPEGTLGSNVKMVNKVMVQGPGGAWGGDGAALSFFVNSWNHR